MLTREHAIAVYDADRVLPDRLMSSTHRQYSALAEAMCRVYREGVGRTRQSLHQAVQSIFANELECPTRRIAAFCKLLDEASEYDRDEKGKVAKLRQQVFTAAASLHPLVTEADPWFENDLDSARKKVAESVGKSWPEIDQELFGDLIEFQRLRTFNGFESPIKLLSRYNVAQVQVALFDAIRMTVWASQDLKTILRYAKLARLMHRIERLADGSYRFDFDGPASLLNRTHRYGVAMARFLPGLLACRGWKLQATLQPPRWHRQVTLELHETSGLSSPIESDAPFDSQIEEKFFEDWGGEPRNGWRLERESEILHSGQRVYVPDFAFYHADGRRVLFEIIGFWTPEYLQQKSETLQFFSSENILLAVAKSVYAKLPNDPSKMILFKKDISVEEVLKRLEGHVLR